MAENTTHKTNGTFAVRRRLPHLFRYVALGCLVLVLGAVVIGLYKARIKPPFKLKGEHAQLSTDVTAQVSNYERLETDNGVRKYLVRADQATIFADNHQELENANIEIYDDAGNEADKLRADRILYVPEDSKYFTAYLNGGVRIDTRDQLTVSTENVVYTKSNEVAAADEQVEFTRGSIRGRSFGANVQIASKKLDLLKDVEIDYAADNGSGDRGKINAGSASYDQASGKIDLNAGAKIRSETANAGVTDLQAERAIVLLTPGDVTGPQSNIRSIELFDGVHITSVKGEGPTSIDAGYGLYETGPQRFELRDGVSITTTSDDKPVSIKAANAVYERGALKLSLNGNAEVTQGTNYFKGNSINADLFADQKVRSAVIRGDGLVRQSTTERTIIVSSPELNADFNEKSELVNANAVGPSVAQLVPANSGDFSSVTMSAPNAIALGFAGGGLLEKLRTVGRTTVEMQVPDGDVASASKRLIADAVTTTFSSDGRSIAAAAAVGNAEFSTQPLHASGQNYQDTVTAPRIDCSFFPTGNNVKQCVAGKRARVVRTPTVKMEEHGVQTLLADQMTADFAEGGKSVEAFTAIGGAKFTELTRTVTAGRMAYTRSDEIARFRGGEPTAVDENSRGKAAEIDWDTKNNKAYLRGTVSVTYNNRKKMGDAVPFASTDRPVYATGDSAELDQNAQTAVFTGNARGWQDSNFVRADRLFIDQKQGKLAAEGNVQSQLSDLKSAKSKTRGPVFATARHLAYDRETKLVQYRENVDIRQGTDHLTAGSADIYLDEDNTIARTVAQVNVVMTQPGRRASGDWIEYSAADDTATLRGNPASITDAENGSSQSPEISFNSRQNRAIATGASKQSPSGRVRTVIKVKPQ